MHGGIHHSHPQASAGQAVLASPGGERLMRLATHAALAVAGVLVAIKLYAWLETDSVAILSSLTDSSMDLLMSAVNFMAVRYALLPPDEDHRFGHTAAEDVAALGQSMFIAGSAIIIFMSALHQVFDPEPTHHSATGIWVMGVSMVLTTLLVLFQTHVTRQTRSGVIKADRLHYVGDVLMNASVIFALIAAERWGWTMADPILGVIIAMLIFHNAWGIARHAFGNIMDKEMPESDREAISAYVVSVPGVFGLHHLKTRMSGTKPFIQFHLELDGTQTLNEAHRIADGIEQELLKRYPGGEVIIHEDPVGQARD